MSRHTQMKILIHGLICKVLVLIALGVWFRAHSIRIAYKMILSKIQKGHFGASAVITILLFEGSYIDQSVSRTRPRSLKVSDLRFYKFSFSSIMKDLKARFLLNSFQTDSRIKIVV